MCIGETGCHRPRAERGVSLIELIIFILLVSIAAVAVLGGLNLSTTASADAMIRKQALAIAEAVLEEVQLMPFTYCDPDDRNAGTALDTTGCDAAVESAGPEALDVPPGPPGGPAETRAGLERPFDNVNDYNGYNPPIGITDITGAAITGLGNYDILPVTVVGQSVDGVIPAAESLLITVTVDGPPGSNTTVVLQGYRVRYAPLY